MQAVNCICWEETAVRAGLFYLSDTLCDRAKLLPHSQNEDFSCTFVGAWSHVVELG